MKAKALVDGGAEVPSALQLELLKEKLNSGDCVTKGWVLEGYGKPTVTTGNTNSAASTPRL